MKFELPIPEGKVPIRKAIPPARYMELYEAVMKLPAGSVLPIVFEDQKEAAKLAGRAPALEVRRIQGHAAGEQALRAPEERRGREAGRAHQEAPRAGQGKEGRDDHSVAMAAKPLSKILQIALLEICARTLTEVLLKHHTELSPEYLWRLKGAIRHLRGQKPDRKRG